MPAHNVGKPWQRILPEHRRQSGPPARAKLIGFSSLKSGFALPVHDRCQPQNHVPSDREKPPVNPGHQKWKSRDDSLVIFHHAAGYSNQAYGMWIPSNLALRLVG